MAAYETGKGPYNASGADVAQLVEHFTRNEGVSGSIPLVGLSSHPQALLEHSRSCCRARTTLPPFGTNSGIDDRFQPGEIRGGAAPPWADLRHVVKAQIRPSIEMGCPGGYSMNCYSNMTERSQILHVVMKETGTSQSELSRLSGVHQPSISQFLSGRVDLSDEKLDRLLSSMGYRLEVTRRPVRPELNRSEMRSWNLHREISRKLNSSSLEMWRPVIEGNLRRLKREVKGQPHHRNLSRWEQSLKENDVLTLHRVLAGLDRDSIEMREVSPMRGILSQDERSEILGLRH